MFQEGPARWGDSNIRCHPSLREWKPIKIPEVKLNITLPPITSSALSGEDVTHIVDQTVSVLVWLIVCKI
jgi:hypothetical protein